MASKFRWLLLGIAAVGAAAGWFIYGRDANDAPTYRFARVDRGAILRTVSSTGKLNPVVTVQVGSQVSGQLSELLADFNTVVKAQQVIARIDPASFEAKVMEARADLAFAKANVAMQQATFAEYKADLKGARAALKDVEQDLRRKEALLRRRVVSRSVVDKALAVRDQAGAKLESVTAKLEKQKAQVETARARVEEKTATLRHRDLDLEHTIIRSPVDGVVISRDVDIGQTVAASLQAPVLFTIAQDLRRMQVELSVDEADIGRIRESQEVTFTVDAYPNRTFSGAVRQIRKAPKEVSNVVTYTVVVSTDNPDLALLPGMTANVEVIVGRRRNALRVANAALRFRPPGAKAPAPNTGGRGRGRGREAARARAQARMKRLTEALSLTPEQQQQVRAIYSETGRKIGGMRRSGAPREQIRQAAQQMRARNRRRIEALLDEEQRRKFRLLQAENVGRRNRPGQVWILGADGTQKPVEVLTGLSDINVTEIVRGELKESDRVIVGVSTR